MLSIEYLECFVLSNRGSKHARPMLGLTAKSFVTQGTPWPRLRVPVWLTSSAWRTEPIKTHCCSSHHKNPIRRLCKNTWRIETAGEICKKILKDLKESWSQLQLALSRNLDPTPRMAQGTAGAPYPPACCPSRRHSHEPKVRGQSIWRAPFKGGPVWCTEGSHWVQKRWLTGRSESPMGYFVYTKRRLQWADVIVTGIVCFPLKEFISSGRGYVLDLCLPCCGIPSLAHGVLNHQLLWRVRNSASLPDARSLPLLIHRMENNFLFVNFFLDTFKST